MTEAVVLAQPPQTAEMKAFAGRAVALVRGAGVADAGLLEEVEVRICRLYLAAGMAPDPDTICLSEKHYEAGDVLRAAVTLAHELVHSRQYRTLGVERFQCEYSLEFVRCGACVDEGNAFEKEAYARQERAEAQIRHFQRTGRRLPPAGGEAGPDR